MPKANKNNPITHQELAQELAQMSNDILISIDRVYRNQQSEIQTLSTRVSRVEQKLDSLEQKVDKNFSELMGRFADVIGEIQSFREAMTIFPHQISRQVDRSDDHEKRITGLEVALLPVFKE